MSPVTVIGCGLRREQLTLEAAQALERCDKVLLHTRRCGLADYLWNYPRVMCIFWFVFALTIAGIKVCRRETETD